MERLEPVLKQKFWILLGIGILMTIVGWWMATGTMAATIITRRAEIEAAEKKVPSGEIPNSVWSDGLATVNGQQDLAVKSASRILWERQRVRMTWPETVAEFVWKNGYRGEIDLSGRVNYRTDYDNDWRRVWESVQPFNRINGSGIVDFSPAKLPRQSWGNLAPSSDEMWDAQEDLWLQEGILQLIAEVNGGATSTRLDACIHQIERLTLHGGQPVGQRTVAPVGGGTSGGAVGAEMMTSGFGGGNSGGGTGGGGSAVSVDFDVKEELGGDSAGGGQDAVSGQSMPGGLGGSGTTGARSKRYIDDDKALPFRTRGFYMTLIMDHRKIPNLIAELSASEKSAWPIEIVRVQYVRLHEDDTDSKGTGGGSGPGMSLSESFGGAGSAGSSGESGFGGGAAAGVSLEGGTGGSGVTTSQSQVAIAALMSAMQDPNMARVTICGIITLYNEVKPEDAPAIPAGSQPATPSPGAAATQAEPVDGAAPSTETNVGTDAKSSAPADGEPAKPDSNATPTPEATPKKDETTPATPEAKPADTP